jgi:thiamine biosynthesis protein ThiI
MYLPIVLVRFNEIALKSRNTRSALRRLLRHNILSTLRMNAVPFEGIEDTWERLIIHSNESEKVAHLSSMVFGVASASPAVECASKIETFSNVVSNMARERLKAGDSFALRVRRVGEHAFTTNEIAIRCGSSIVEALKKDGSKVKVNLDSPDHEFFIEVRGERTFVYSEVMHGVGGLPLGSQGKVVSRLDDFESILATWLMMKRGCWPILVSFDSEKDLGGSIDAVSSSLLPYSGAKLPIIELPVSKIIGKNVSTLPLEECLKYLAMSNIAQFQGAEGIVSSERFVPSNTSQLRTAREYVGIVDLPIFYPLVGLDDEYLRGLAERIGGRALSLKIGEKDYSRRELHEDIRSNMTCNLDSVIREYQERIKELVVSALATAGL